MKRKLLAFAACVIVLLSIFTFTGCQSNMFKGKFDNEATLDEINAFFKSVNKEIPMEGWGSYKIQYSYKITSEDGAIEGYTESISSYKNNNFKMAMDVEEKFKDERITGKVYVVNNAAYINLKSNDESFKEKKSYQSFINDGYGYIDLNTFNGLFDVFDENVKDLLQKGFKFYIDNKKIKINYLNNSFYQGEAIKTSSIIIVFNNDYKLEGFSLDFKGSNDSKFDIKITKHNKEPKIPSINDLDYISK